MSGWRASESGCNGGTRFYTKEIQREEEHRHCGSWPEEHERRIPHVLRPFGDKDAEGSQRLLHTKTEEGEKALKQDHAGDKKGHIDDDRSERVRDDVAPNDRAA